VRLLVATRINADFLGEIRAHFGSHDGFEMRFVDFADVHELDRFAKNPDKIVFQALAGKPGLPKVAEAAFREHLDWADVVFVEWCTALAALLTQADPRDTRVVVRMHSYEAFTLWPHLMDFSRVDDLVFVSEHLRDLAVAAIPGLQQEDRPRLHVVANAMELQRFVRPKTSDDVRFTLGVIGASKMVKDPRWAIDVVRELRRHDERYRLVLVRGKLQDQSAPAQAYAADLRRDLAELEPSGAVQVLGHTDDVPAVLEGIGVALSSSVRESFHMGLVEAVASGALPVVRDWPFFPGAARELFPADWVVDTPGHAAERILALTQDAEVWRPAAAEASRHVRERWDWPVVRTSFEELFDYRKASG
jgi:glycosyltransferase involved in cell wall biosynthesis